MKRITGPVFEDVVLHVAAEGVESEREITCLRRAKLWDTAMQRPDDRVPAIRMGGVEGLERGYAMHRTLDPLNLLDVEAHERYDKGIYKYRTVWGTHRGAINKANILRALRDWPTEWRRLWVGEHGGVPVDVVIIGLVALGFSPPKKLVTIGNLARGIPLNSGGMTFDWPLLACPS
jgi:hypothetical protein